MKFLSLLAMTATLLGAPVAMRAACPAELGRAEAAVLLAHGRLPDAAVVAGAETRPLTELLADARRKLAADPAARSEVFARAHRDVFGRAPAGQESAAAPARLYTEHVQALLTQLAGQPDEYRRVLGRVYRELVGREPYAEEFEYWAQYPTFTYVLLVGSVENWARRNAPGLMVTTGVPMLGSASDQLALYRLAPTLADEVRQTLGQSIDARALAAGRTVIGPGAEAVTSIAGVHLLVVDGKAAR